MKNKKVKMILGAAALAVCCSAYIGVKTYVAQREEQEITKDEAETSVSVFETSASDIKSISFMIDEEEVTFEKEDDIWVKQDEERFPVNQTTLDGAVSSLANIKSDRVLENAEDLGQYGLDKPSNIIKIKAGVPADKKASDQNGETEKTDSEESGIEKAKSSGESHETTLRIGDLNESANQYYVSKGDDENTVYLVDSSVVEPFMNKLYDYAQKEDFPVVSDTSTVNKVTVTKDEENSYILEKDADTGFWYIGSEEKADSAAASSLAASLGSMAYGDLVDYDCEDESKYGLDQPYAVIEADYQEEKPEEDTAESEAAENDEEEAEGVNPEENESEEEGSEKEETDASENLNAEETDASENLNAEETDIENAEDELEEPEMVDKSLKIIVGNETEDGSRYVRVNDSKQIYTMPAGVLSPYLDKGKADFWDMTVKYLPLNSLEKLEVEYGNEKHEINVSRETSENEDGETEETTTYTLDGTEIEETVFTTFYNKLNNMIGDRRLTESFESETEPEMVVSYTTADESFAAEYYLYDTNYYAVVVDEKIYLVNKMTVKSMIEAYETVIGKTAK